MDNSVDKLVICCVIVLTLSVLSIMAGVKQQKENKENSYNIDVNLQKECEHDWVVTSEYDYWLKSYRTFSKCSKCGKEI